MSLKKHTHKKQAIGMSNIDDEEQAARVPLVVRNPIRIIDPDEETEQNREQPHSAGEVPDVTDVLRALGQEIAAELEENGGRRRISEILDDRIRQNRDEIENNIELMSAEHEAEAEGVDTENSVAYLTKTEVIAEYLQRRRVEEEQNAETIASFNLQMDMETKRQMYSEISLQNALAIISINNKATVRQGWIMLENIIEDVDFSYGDRLRAAEMLATSGQRQHMGMIDTFLDTLVLSDLDGKEKYVLLMMFINSNKFGALRSWAEERIQTISCECQWKYFTNDGNPLRYRLLSGQYLVCASFGLSQSRRLLVCEILADIMEGRFELSEVDLNIRRVMHPRNEINEQRVTEQIRADAADILLRYGEPEFRQKADLVIHEMGFDEGGYTVYENKHNVHSRTLQKSVERFLDQLAKDRVPIIKYIVRKEEADGTTRDVLHKRIQTLVEVTAEIENALDAGNVPIDNDDKEMVREVMERIELDKSTYGKSSMRIADVLQRVWNRIKGKEDEDFRKFLMMRLVQELLDTHGWCGSGHVSRIAQVLSGPQEEGYDFEMRISFREQVVANVKARMEAKIRHLGESHMQTNILEGMALPADDTVAPARIAFNNFVTSHTKALRRELFSEFVEDGHISSGKFMRYFAYGMELFLGNIKPALRGEDTDEESGDEAHPRQRQGAVSMH